MASVIPSVETSEDRMGQGFLDMAYPQVTVGFNTKSWSFMTWMIYEYL